VDVSEGGLSDFFSVVTPLLDERQRRVVAGAAARMLGRGGVTAVARVASMSRNTVIGGAKEIASGEAAATGRVRREGGGRKRLIEKDPRLSTPPFRGGIA
jgi:hypothetical protein